ncbi:MAG TPA: hypothetical protein VHB79_27320 [Polyangiaceae bacterium]|nr:hypothetical protein [Polyangiaceae bacterium]
MGFSDAAFKRRAPWSTPCLKARGDLAGLVEVDGDFALLRLVMRRAAAVSPLSSVEQPPRPRLYRERRSRALDDFIAQLRRETPIEIANNPQ